MKIGFGEISDQGLRLEINDPSWFPDQEINRQGPVRAWVFMERKGVDRVLLSGEIETGAALDCDRCLETFQVELAGRFRVDLECVAEVEQPVEHRCSMTDMDTVFLDEPAVDIFEILVQQVFLMLPAKTVCHENCRGLCPHCGINLNAHACDCSTGTGSSPFTVLAGLKKKKP